jgi:hypothetical protein
VNRVLDNILGRRSARGAERLIAKISDLEDRADEIVRVRGEVTASLHNRAERALEQYREADRRR